MYLFIITDADGSRMGRMFSGIYSSACLLVFAHDISKTDAPRTTELDTEIFHHESWKSIYFGVEKLKVKVTRHKKNITDVGHGAL